MRVGERTRKKNRASEREVCRGKKINWAERQERWGRETEKKIEWREREKVKGSVGDKGSMRIWEKLQLERQERRRQSE